jgi:Rnl2 family RNA ligase
MFKQYPKGKNIDKKIIHSIVDAGIDKVTDWICCEKIHGANACIIVNSVDIKFARRRAIVESGDKFYNYEKIIDKYIDKLRQLYTNIKDVYTTVDIVRVYGELYGGIYPDQKSIDIPVQQGVYYSPTVEFMAFDLHIEMVDGASEWLSYKNYSFELDKVGIPYIVPLFEGSLKEAIDMNNYFETTIPKIHGLPPIKDNICEGS